MNGGKGDDGPHVVVPSSRVSGADWEENGLAAPIYAHDLWAQTHRSAAPPFREPSPSSRPFLTRFKGEARVRAVQKGTINKCRACGG